MSFVPVSRYLIGLGMFGFLYWLLDGILTLFIDEGVHTAGAAFDLIHALWTGGLLIYIIFGGWYVIRTYNEKNQYGGQI